MLDLSVRWLFMRTQTVLSVRAYLLLRSCCPGEPAFFIQIKIFTIQMAVGFILKQVTVAKWMKIKNVNSVFRRP